ncbi:MAG: Nif3-like dinuclear metal center hexameric protein [Bacteroidia bacterium]|nr:Nif3-like dinuclear metal center hexameric protein [Bacteroidia bacterium]MDW8235880.1 Nif3-like dinuclear metal center hexameric protein [Bacteroidia bacterium]
MIRLREVITALEAWAPPQWADSYDNVGLLWGDPDMPLSGVLTTLDITSAVLEEARSLHANLIVSHHPLWFGEKNRLHWGLPADRLTYLLIQAGISVYAIHTNIDQAPDGVSYVLCKVLDLRPVGFLRTNGGTHGAGYIGEYPQPLEAEAFLRHLQKKLELPAIRYTAGSQPTIRRVGVCGGAGSFLLPEALHAGVDAFLTADIPYHRFFEAEGRIWLADIGHYESERWIAQIFADFLHQKFPFLPVFTTRIRTSPIQHWI